ncbi:MAG: MFS transporter [Deltaproteobacteria bacterium]|nr:MFS transporter [Deltaproteobacteria bacterium]
MNMNPSSDSSAPEREQPWQRTLYVMFAAQLLSIIGFAFVLPFLPFYIRELGVTDERLVPVWAGVLAGSAGLVMAFFSPLWGWLADRQGRKIMVERAMFGGAVLTFAMGLVSNVWQLLFLRLLQGATTGTISASVALVSTVVPRQRLGYALGLMQTAVFLGMTLGPWIGGIMADVIGYRYTFMAGGAMLLLGGALVLFGTQERFIRPSKETLAKGDRLFSLLAYGGFPAMLALFFFFHFTAHFVAPILPLFIETMCDAARGGVASTTGMLFAISGGTAALSAGGIGYLSDRIGYKRILLFHLVLTAVSMLLHGAAQGIFHLVLLRILYGLAAGGIIPTMNALVGRLIPPASYGKAYGLTSSMTALGMAAGPLSGGIMASAWGYRWPFVFVGALMIAVALTVVLGIRSRPR